MQMPKPGPGHLKMERLAGTWEGEETMYPSQWDPKGGTAIGRSTNKLALGGFALINEYEQERDGAITFTGHGVMTFDPKSEEYSLHWFDCIGSPPEVFTGRFDGDLLILGHGGPGMHARFTHDLGEVGRMKTRMEMSHDGGRWKTMFEGSYRARR
jgi:hypothetical protein